MKLIQPVLPGIVSVDEAERAVWASWTEAQLLNYCRNTAKMAGYRVYHTKFSINSDAGFPDLCMARGTRLIFAELKRQGKWPTLSRRGTNGRWITGQTDWLHDLAACPPAEAYIWWPSDVRDIATILTDFSNPDMPCVERTRDWLICHPPVR